MTFNQRTVGCLLVALGFWLMSRHCQAETPGEAKNTGRQGAVRQVDHILIASSEAQQLFTLLSDTLRLPVAWPFSDYGNFASGGVAVGNVNLEVTKDSQSSSTATKSHWTGFALEPQPLKTALSELDARHIPHGPPAPFRSGSFTTRWTTVALPSVSSDAVEVFLCEYNHDVSARRTRLLTELQSRNGGPLTVQSVREITVGAKDAARSRDQWQKLLNPPSPADVWPLGAGPTIRVIPAKKDEIAGLVINVNSLDQARRFLKAHDLLGKDQSDSLTLAGPPLAGLNITLVERALK